MTLAVIIISNITVIIVAHFLLAASLTVRHGLGPPPPGCGSSSGCSRPPRPGGQTRGLRETAGAAALAARTARSGTERVPGGPESAERGWQRRRRATLGKGRPPGGGAASWEQPLRPRGGGSTAQDGRRDRTGVDATGRGCSSAPDDAHTHSSEVRTSRPYPVLEVPNALPPGSPLGLARTGCTGAEPAHSAPAQTDPGQSRPLRQGSRLSPPPPPRRAGPSPPRAAGTPRGTR